jgi:hypothetical protein
MSDEYEFTPQWPVPSRLTVQQQEAIAAYQEAGTRYNIDSRLALVRYGFLFCSCRRWYETGGNEPPQAACIVHSAVMCVDEKKGTWI